MIDSMRVDQLVCAVCGERFAAGTPRCPRDGTALRPALATEEATADLRAPAEAAPTAELEVATAERSLDSLAQTLEHPASPALDSEQVTAKQATRRAPGPPGEPATSRSPARALARGQRPRYTPLAPAIPARRWGRRALGIGVGFAVTVGIVLVALWLAGLLGDPRGATPRPDAGVASQDAEVTGGWIQPRTAPLRD
jgi:hypothetical protein